jgi:hypothetical protein
MIAIAKESAMPCHVPVQPERVGAVNDHLVAAIRANMLEMTRALDGVDVIGVEIELPYRADWSGEENAS